MSYEFIVKAKVIVKVKVKVKVIVEVPVFIMKYFDKMSIRNHDKIVKLKLTISAAQ